MTQLASPLTPLNCDLRDFPFMPLDVVRLRDSDIAALSSGEEFRSAVLLWCASWHQIPAASLPNDDTILSQLAGFGRVTKEWKRVKSGALRGWVLCEDNRLYHPVIAEKANDAWAAKLTQRWKTECARIKKQNQRLGTDDPFPSLESFLSLTCPSGQYNNVPRDMHALSPLCPSGNSIQEKERGRGTEIGTEINKKREEEQPLEVTTTLCESVCDALRKLGVEGVNPHNPKLLRLIKAGVKASEFSETAREQKSRGKGFPWLLATVEGRRKDAAASEPLAKASAEKQWFETASGIEDRGRSIGVTMKPGETFQHFKVRVFDAAKLSPDVVRKARIDAGMRP